MTSSFVHRPISVRFVAVLVSVALATAACGGDDDGPADDRVAADSVEDSTVPDSAATETTAPETVESDESGAAVATTTEPAAPGAGDSAAEGRTVEHRHGTTVVPDDPQRVVTIGFTDQDYVLALGVVPVGIRDWFGEQPNAVWPWARDLLGGAEPEVLSRELNYEAIAALDPDLIIAVYAGLTDDEYDLLDAIAPTVTQPREIDDYAITWQEQTRFTGEILGRAAQAEVLVGELEGKIDQARADHPEFDGSEYAFASAFDGDYYLYGATSTASRFLLDLGFVVPDDVAELTDNDNDYFLFGAERMDLVDRPVTVWSEGEDDPNIAALLDSPLYTGLAVHQEGRDLFLGLDLYGGAFSFSSVLSLDLLVDDLVPALAAAIDGDPATVPELSN